MASYRDKDFHKMRNLDAYGLDSNFKTPFTKQEAEAKKKLDKIASKYGFKEKVEDKRRRCNSRKSNQSAKQMVSQMDRARGKQGLIKILKEI